MSTDTLERLYQLIAEKLVEIIPDEWKKIYLYAEILSDSRTIYFYYESQTLNRLVYSHNIPETYEVEESIYNDMLSELGQYFDALHAESKKISLEDWSSLTMYLDNTGKFSIDFDYKGKYKLGLGLQKVVWKYEVLGIYPSDEYYQKKLDDYLKNQEHN